MVGAFQHMRCKDGVLYDNRVSHAGGLDMQVSLPPASTLRQSKSC
ncbi:hypothetical protein M3J09_000109 [Ascochyta lentis]